MNVTVALEHHFRRTPDGLRLDRNGLCLSVLAALFAGV